MTKTNHSIGRKNRISRFGVSLVIAVLLFVAVQIVQKLYLAQEFLIVLLGVGLLMAMTLVLAVAFVLFQEGIRQTVRWGKTGFALVAGASHRPVNPPETIVHPPR